MSARRPSPAQAPLRSPKRVVVPVNLGCCPTEPRCTLCAPPRPPSVEAFQVLLAQAREAHPEDEVWVGFYGGPPPSDAMLDAARGAPVTVRVRPDLLSREQARALVRAGVIAIELDAWSFDDHALKTARRPYRAKRVRQMCAGLRELGVEVGLVLAIGLPGTTHDTVMADAAEAAKLADTARLHPVLVLKHADLADAWRDGRYTPLTRAEAITSCRDMLDVLEEAGVEVVRIGQQPGPDELGTALAGPVHSSMREAIEARRTLDRLRALPAPEQHGEQWVIRCAPEDETRTRGPLNQHIRDLRATFRLAEVRVSPDPQLRRGELRVERTHPDLQEPS